MTTHRAIAALCLSLVAASATAVASDPGASASAPDATASTTQAAPASTTQAAPASTTQAAPASTTQAAPAPDSAAPTSSSPSTPAVAQETATAAEPQPAGDAAPAAATPAPAAGRKLSARELRDQVRASQSPPPPPEVAPVDTDRDVELEQAAPPPAPPEPPRFNAVAFHPLPLVGGFILGAMTKTSMTFLLFEYTRALTPNIAAYGRFGTTNVTSATGSRGGIVIGAGMRWHFAGEVLRGPFAAAGFTAATVGSSTTPTIHGLGGYSIEHRGFFFAPAVGVALDPSGDTTMPAALTIEAPIGFAF